MWASRSPRTRTRHARGQPWRREIAAPPSPRAVAGDARRRRRRVRRHCRWQRCKGRRQDGGGVAAGVGMEVTRLEAMEVRKAQIAVTADGEARPWSVFALRCACGHRAGRGCKRTGCTGAMGAASPPDRVLMGPQQRPKSAARRAPGTGMGRAKGAGVAAPAVASSITVATKVLDRRARAPGRFSSAEQLLRVLTVGRECRTTTRRGGLRDTEEAMGGLQWTRAAVGDGMDAPWSSGASASGPANR